MRLPIMILLASCVVAGAMEPWENVLLIRHGRAGSNVWTPSDMVTRAWYDASDSNTVSLSGSSVTGWADKSGNGRNLSVSGTASWGTRTLNDHEVIDFSSSYVYLSGGITGTENSGFVIAVWKSDDTSPAIVNNYFDISWNGTDSRLYCGSHDVYSTDGIRLGAAGGVDDIGWAQTTAPMLFCGGRDFDSNGCAYVNGTLAGTDNTLGNVNNATAQSVSIGNQMDGYIAEFILLLNVPSESDRQKAEGYLAHKWGLTANLPPGHPYKLSPPTK